MEPKTKKVKAEKLANISISDTNWINHYQLFNHLIAAGPRMHGKPSERVKKSH